MSKTREERLHRALAEVYMDDAPETLHAEEAYGWMLGYNDAVLALREFILVWQPIETAPKDGRYVLLMIPAWYHPPRWRVARWKDTGATSGFEGYYGPEPTHWMPLPPPPAQED